MSWMQGIAKALDVALPEELLGLDITRGMGGTDPGFFGIGRKAEKKIHSVIVDKGALRRVSDGRIMGYTPQAAKKKYKTKRRAKRWTQRDEKEMQWKLAIAQAAAGKVVVPP